MKIILLGPPGAGKGTQGELLGKELNLSRLSTGALLRRVWKEGGPLGEKIGQYMLKGLNVPASVLFEALDPWFETHQDGFIADNLPRNIDQLTEFKKFLEKRKTKIDKVFHLIISKEEGIRRIQQRHKYRSIQGDSRPDEDKETLKARVEEGYKKEIKSVLEYFQEMGILVNIDGEKSIEEVHQEIMEHLYD